MAERFSRQNLYELVWAEPMSTAAKRFGISDVALKKVCAKSHVPVPPRGHWAKNQAGKKTWKVPLPPRPPGMVDEIEIGSRSAYPYPGWTEAEILGPIPDPPSFEEPLESVRERVRKQIRRVAVARNLSNPHPTIGRVLQDDELRAEKSRTSPFVLTWDKPLFDTPLARRRLRIVSALFLATARAGGKGTFSAKESESFGVSVHQQHVRIRLAAGPKRRHRAGAEGAHEREKPTLRLSLLCGFGGDIERISWEDDAVALEHRIGEIAVEVIVTAELQHREHCIRLHDWRVQRKAELEEEQRKRAAEAERKRRERETALAKERIERLLAQAKALTDARAIRAYVDAACSTPGAACVDAGVLEAWRVWALQQAERLDPVASGSVLDGIAADRPIMSSMRRSRVRSVILLAVSDRCDLLIGHTADDHR